MCNKYLRIKILISIFILVMIDQVLKNAVLAFLVMPRKINDLLSMEIYRNYGIAFGLPVSANVFYILFFFYLIFIYLGAKKKAWGDWRGDNRERIFAMFLIIAGALANITDRIRWGYIIDYINIGGILIFNLADVYIAGGALILLSGYFPHAVLTDKKLKKRIYIFLFAVLGIIFSFLVHAIIETRYIGLLISDFGKYGLGFAWPFWYSFHSVATVLLFIVGAVFGYGQGKYWWKVLYEKNKNS